MTEKSIDDFLQIVTKGEERKEETEQEKVLRFMERLNLTEVEAKELIEFDKGNINELTEIEKNKKVEYVKKKLAQTKEPKTKINDDEVERLHDVLIELKATNKEPFNDWFKSKDLNIYVHEFLQPRQIRFRLDKLEKQGYIQSKATKPKTYKLLG